MTDQYDWSKLDAGWKHVPSKDCLVQKDSPYTYWYYSGAVTNGTPWHDPISDKPDEAFAFHTAAREQVAKCRVPDWEARCGELQREREFLVAQRDEMRELLESRDWQKLTEENEQLRAKLAAPDVDTGIWVCAKLRRHAEDTWLADKRCSYDDAVEWLRPMHAAVASIFPVATWNALVRSGRAR
jgi:hypothetical protein